MNKNVKKIILLLIICIFAFGLIGCNAISQEEVQNNTIVLQQDIALFMKAYAECRSNTRATIGYEDQDNINVFIERNQNSVENAKSILNKILVNLSTDEEKFLYQKIHTALNDYLEKEAEIIQIGSTTDQDCCRVAEDLEMNELTPLYDSLDEITLELLNIVSEK